jgi:hypothetical protein
MTVLDVQRAWALPLTEVSALTIRREGAGDHLMGVGDEDFAVVVAGLRDADVEVPSGARSLQDLLGDDILDAPDGSEFEGVAVDADGDVFILQEGPARVLVLTPDLSQFRLRINLAVDPERPDFGFAWLNDRNSRGEALLVLPNGHLLIAKQREPTTLIEFGPAPDRALGWQPETLARRPSFPFGESAELEYEVLADWHVMGDEEGISGINDLAVDDRGVLYGISSKRRRIVRFELSRELGFEAAQVAAGWSLPAGLPGGEEGKPEGLTLLSGRTPLISIDTKEVGDNVVRLDPISGDA